MEKKKNQETSSIHSPRGECPPHTRSDKAVVVSRLKDVAYVLYLLNRKGGGFTHTRGRVGVASGTRRGEVWWMERGVGKGLG